MKGMRHERGKAAHFKLGVNVHNLRINNILVTLIQTWIPSFSDQGNLCRMANG